MNMDYEKAYKDALERAKEIHDSPNASSGRKEWLESIFPELAESEDERIRKELVEYFSNTGCNFIRGIPIGRVRDYLEKKKEQKPADRIEDSVKFEEGFKAGRELGLRDGQKYVLDNFDSYGLCKPAEWSEEDEEGFKMVANCLSSFYNLSDDVAQRDRIDSAEIWLNNRVRSLRPQPKTEWSEEDEKMYQTLIHDLGVICEKDYPDNVNLKKDLDWLKSLRPQPKQEWTEKDEARLGNLLSFLDGRLGILPGWKADCKNWLLSRFRALSPQPHWKPSEEQMGVLEYYMNTLMCTKNTEILFGLYNDLKKLM